MVICYDIKIIININDYQYWLLKENKICICDEEHETT